ncbi:peptidoglycan editing factor PgeF [Ferrimonas sediminicola]|uniref:Purine nucleoside phosphorylase n=1 Tax=Ferrimonas sediminicola TaxID=2569538 RepID=A0A4U1BDF5_9GAMM|nr:peptidoglycan editing factor PgeF [Ferrimonas sediminicola]TKB48789.1 peptidoglycan editing factor PgeF [Ferrimonas sediminicola]
MWFSPDWSLPDGVVAASTDRLGGSSLSPYDGFNLGSHVGDAPEAVALNRQRLRQGLGLPNEPAWLEQVHGTRVVTLPCSESLPQADATYTREPDQVCVVMTADCLPVLLCHRDGTQVAAAHAGWRGLCDGVLEQAVSRFGGEPGELLAWIGPAISAEAFEVGPEVRAQFLARAPGSDAAFTARGDKFLADLPQLACRRLQALGLTHITLSHLCTFADRQRFFSYRRDGRCGRMASLIWIR